MALTANRVSYLFDEGKILRQEVDGTVTKIYDGSILASNPGGTGLLLNGVDTASFVFRGIALEEYPRPVLPQDVVVTPTDTKIDVSIPGSGRVFRLPIVTAIDDTNIGDSVYIVDDESVDLAAGVTNNILVGTIVGYESANLAYVRI